MADSVNKKVKKYLDENPSIKDNIDIVNFSKLSRKMIDETNLREKDFDAILVSLRRINYIRKKNSITKVKDIFEKSSVDIRTKSLVCIVEKDSLSVADLHKEIRKRKGIVHTIEGTNATTIITSNIFKNEVERIFKNKIIRMIDNLVEIVIKSPVSLENIPGYVSHIYSLIGSMDINIVETVSCWDDTIIVIDSKDLNKVMEILKVTN